MGFVIINNFLVFNEKNPTRIFYIFLTMSILGSILFLKKLQKFDEYAKKFN